MKHTYIHTSSLNQGRGKPHQLTINFKIFDIIENRHSYYSLSLFNDLTFSARSPKSLQFQALCHGSGGIHYEKAVDGWNRLANSQITVLSINISKSRIDI